MARQHARQGGDHQRRPRLGHTDHYDPRMRSRREPGDAGEVQVEGEEHPPFPPGCSCHGLIVSTTQTLLDDGVHIVALLGQQCSHPPTEILIELEPHPSSGRGSSSSVASAAPYPSAALMAGSDSVG